VLELPLSRQSFTFVLHPSRSANVVVQHRWLSSCRSLHLWCRDQTIEAAIGPGLRMASQNRTSAVSSGARQHLR